MTILLLEDDQILGESLKELLELSHYKVDIAHTGAKVFDLTFENSYDLYILDINVPDMNGFDILESLRKAEDTTPAIYITALTDIQSISKAFAIGVDDYIKKPFDPEELLLRIKSKYEKENTLIKIQDIEYNQETRSLKKEGIPLYLGVVQQDILHALMTAENNIIDNNTLMTFLQNPNLNALRVHIVKLKAKLGISIKNVRGQGYIIEKI